MNYKHKELASGRWTTLSFPEQMANIGSEVIRTNKWKEKNHKLSNSAFERSLELIDLTVADKKNKKRLRELLRMREIWVDYIAGENDYQSSDQRWERYFHPFNYLARK